jgi:hypothetical protein
MSIEPESVFLDCLVSSLDSDNDVLVTVKTKDDSVSLWASRADVIIRRQPAPDSPASPLRGLVKGHLMMRVNGVVQVELLDSTKPVKLIVPAESTMKLGGRRRAL